MTTFSRFSTTSNTPSRSDDSPADSKALEVNLHDSLDRLEDFTLMMAFQSSAIAFEILADTPSAHRQQTQTPQHSSQHTHNRHEKVINIQSASLKKTA